MEGDPRLTYASQVSYRFNPRPRVEGDMRRGVKYCSFRGFNPRPRVEGDAGERNADGESASFNPRPRVEGDRLRYR